jgi:hypothetical protein
VPQPCDKFQTEMTVFWLTRIGSVMAGGGIGWAVYTGTRDIDLNGAALESAFRNIFLQSGPMEICAAGILIWILGRWRGTVVVR